MIESLRSGRVGVELHLPSHLNSLRDEELCAELVDESTGVAWFLFFFPGLHLDLCDKHRADLGRSLQWYARSMFDDTFRRRDHGEGRSTPRTADPSWSPLVDVEYLEIAGAQALRTVHRMAYEPGCEILMGHLLVPLQQGLFEARAVCGDQTTGYRESLLLEKRLRERPADGEEEIKRLAGSLRQVDIDDPRHDDTFSRHSLSRTRAAIRWLCTESGLRVAQPASPIERVEVELSHLDCALVPPPRFVYEQPGEPSEDGSFRRVSFCGTDGVEYLQVHRWDNASVKSAADLAKAAESIVRELHESAEVKDMRVEVSDRPPLDQRPRTLVVVEGAGHVGALRNAMSFFLDQRGRMWSVSRFAIAAIPLDALVADLDAAAQSFRCTSR